jgi:hypothetical protein
MCYQSFFFFYTKVYVLIETNYSKIFPYRYGVRKKSTYPQPISTFVYFIRPNIYILSRPQTHVKFDRAYYPSKELDEELFELQMQITLNISNTLFDFIRISPCLIYPGKNMDGMQKSQRDVVAILRPPSSNIMRYKHTGSDMMLQHVGHNNPSRAPSQGNIWMIISTWNYFTSIFK